MPGILNFIFGYKRYSFSADLAAELVECCRVEKMVCRDFTFSGDRAFVHIPFFTSRRFETTCGAWGIHISENAAFGIPALFMRYRHRYGVFVGIAVFIFITLFSSELLWDIRVVGNSSLSEAQVVEILGECGLSVGDRISTIRTPEIETRTLIYSDDIVWISINLLGNIAEVHIIEEGELPKPQAPLGSDIIAERGGVIEWIENIRGYQVVEVGQRVEAGDLLISGTYPAEEGEALRYTSPRGSVFARTEREFSVFVPYEYEEKYYTGREKCEKYFIFFKKQIKFFENCGNLHTECDTIDMVEYFELPFGVVLPFGVRTVRLKEYETRVVERSDESAAELALYILRCRIEGEVPHGMLVEKAVEQGSADGGHLLICRAEFIEDIARNRETAE